MENIDNKTWRTGQVLLQYASVLVLAMVALIAIQRYVQRGLQATYKDATEMVLEGSEGITGIRQAREELAENVKQNLTPLPDYLQYEPYYQESEFTTTVSGTESNPDSSITADYLTGGSSSKTIDEQSSRTGSRNELPWEENEDD
jgi:hypothetical protein